MNPWGFKKRDAMSRKRVVVWEHIDESGIELLNNSRQVKKKGV